jgi:hypothetical protein
MEGVRSVVTNTITGSILISFDVLQVSSQTLLTKVAQHNAIPLLDYKETAMNSKQVTRVWVESRNLNEFQLLPKLLKKTSTFVLKSFDFEVGIFGVFVGFILPAIIEAI